MMIGRVIGNYKIQCKLGEGGMGAVYKGVDTMLDREVAIKALRPELATQTSVVERFRSEAVTLAKLHHPNIATLYSLFRQGDELYMVLEYVRGETLDAILARRGALSADEVIPVFCQILDGINHAHEYGIIHRDIKPANMMLTEKGTLKVLDFGIARLLGSNRMTRAGNIIGTLEYMAPEQVKGLETDARSDIYALGMMLYEVLTGRAPFETENEFELMKLQIEALPPSPRSVNPGVPQEVEEAIMRAIQKNPDDRFQTAAEFREALLDAGFASQGAMYSTSGLYQKASVGRKTPPPISNPATIENFPVSNPEKPPISKDVIKETRLGQPVAAPENSNNGVIKEKHLVEPGYANIGYAESANIGYAETDYYPAESETEKSFFDNLTWIHYAAGFGATMMLGLLVLTPVFFFGGSGSANNNPEVENSVNASVANAEPKPKTAAATPTPPVSKPAVSESARPLARETPFYEPLEPVTPVAEIPEERTSTTSNTRSNPPRRGAATNTNSRSDERKRRRVKTYAETKCELTGDCP